jgi:AcrR family transcriptional regulator
MPKTKEQYEDMRLKSKGVIIDTALNLFVTKGYHATSISMIAKEAGVAIGLMYNYFNSKEDLLFTIMEEHLQKIHEAAELEVRKSIDAKDIGTIIDAFFSSIMKRSDSWKLIITVLFQPDVAKNAKQMIDSLSMHQCQLYEAYFKRIGAQNPEESAQTVAAVLHGALLSFALSGNLDEYQIIRKNVIEKLLLSGV